MRSFLSIISKKTQYPKVESLLKDVGFYSNIKSVSHIVYSTPDAAFLSFDNRPKSIIPYPRINEADRYFIQQDGLANNINLSESNAREEVIDHTTAALLFNEPERINELSIRDFHLHIWDKREKRLIVFRDQIGTWPLYYYMDEKWFIISTEIIRISSLGGVRTEINEEWIADMLVNLSTPTENTFYSNIKLLEPGQLLYSDLKSLKVESYYNLLDALQPEELSPPEIIEIFQTKLQTAIKIRMKDHSSVGAELSGGLDSSAMVSLGYQIARQKETTFHTFSNVLAKEDKVTYYPHQDESYYGSKVLNNLGINDHHELNGEGLGIIAELKSHVTSMGMPTQQLYTMFSDEIYGTVSKLGIPLLLSGFGGDEGVSYSGSGFFEEMAHSGRWNVFLNEMKASYNLQNTPVYRGYIKYLFLRYMPLGKDLSILLKKRKHWKYNKIQGFGYDKEFGQKMQIQSRYMIKKGIQLEPNVMIRQYQKLIHPYVSQRLVCSYLVGIKHGFLYSFPLLDKDLLEFHLSLPTTSKFTNGYGRALLREALRGVVPDSIRLRNYKQGAVVPTVHKRLLKDVDEIKTLIQQSKEYNKYHFLDYNRLDNWLEQLADRENRKGVSYNPNAFYNSLQILLLQDMERTGEYKTGINC